jgi:invasion protein IalB
MRFAIIAAAFGLLLPVSVMAQTQTPPADPAATAAPPADDKLICMDQDSGGNSRLGTRKVCRTQKQWDALPRARR